MLCKTSCIINRQVSSLRGEDRVRAFLQRFAIRMTQFVIEDTLNGRVCAHACVCLCSKSFSNACCQNDQALENKESFSINETAMKGKMEMRRN